MEIKVVEESGLEGALIGMRFSFQNECPIEDINTNLFDRHIVNYKSERIPTQTYKDYMSTAYKLCNKDGGHNKFLRCIHIQAIIRVPAKAAGSYT